MRQPIRERGNFQCPLSATSHWEQTIRTVQQNSMTLCWEDWLLQVPKAPESASAYERDGQMPTIYIYTPEGGRPATWGNGTRIAFTADSKAQIHSFHEQALKFGGKKREESQGHGCITVRITTPLTCAILMEQTAGGLLRFRVSSNLHWQTSTHSASTSSARRCGDRRTAALVAPAAGTTSSNGMSDRSQ